MGDFAHQEMHTQDRAFHGQELAPGLCRWCDGSDKSAQEIKADANTMQNLLPQSSLTSLPTQAIFTVKREPSFLEKWTSLAGNVFDLPKPAEWDFELNC